MGEGLLLRDEVPDEPLEHLVLVGLGLQLGVQRGHLVVPSDLDRIHCEVIL